MSGLLRNKQGCWTCRLRKKKCDEGRPHCSTCESLSITCYGFGPRPDWMDNGDRERAVAKSIKDIVKHTSRRKAAVPSSNPRESNIKIAPKVASDAGESQSSDAGSGLQLAGGVATSSDHGSSQHDGLDKVSPSEHSASKVESILSFSTDESTLLMHFLDCIFPLQYPIYQPGLLAGGRGWLLTLLLRTDALQQAAMALSVLHRRTMMPKDTSQTLRVSALLQQEKHLEACLKSISNITQRSCGSHGLGLTVAIIQMMFFELFTGACDAYKMHLAACITMCQRGFEENEVWNLSLSQQAQAVIFKDRPILEHESSVLGEVVVFKFISSTSLWLDIISSITAGTAPRLLPYHSNVLSSGSQNALEDVMGCENWVMLQISSIAALHARKVEALRQGSFDSAKLQPSVCEIGMEIRHGLTRMVLKNFKIFDQEHAERLGSKADLQKVVTRVFAHMASIYLHLVAYGFKELEALDNTISESMEIFQNHESTSVLPALICPLYIIGCVARPRDEQFFRDVFSGSQLLGALLQHRGRILPSLEKIWEKRQASVDLTWQDSLELGPDVLLV